MSDTIRFEVVREPYGWAVRMGQGMMTPFRSRVTALRHANGVAEALRRRGEPAEVILEQEYVAEAPPPASTRARFRPLWS